MTGFKPQTSSVGSDCSTNWATTTVLLLELNLSRVKTYILAKQAFENVCIYCSKFGDQIPITFVLGFYVTLVVNRWWDQFESIPWPDSASLWVSTCIQGHDERGRLMRRTIVRYLNLGFILCLRLTCLPVKKRFPTLEHLVEAGILEEKEKEVAKHASFLAYWIFMHSKGSFTRRAFDACCCSRMSRCGKFLISAETQLSAVAAFVKYSSSEWAFNDKSIGSVKSTKSGTFSYLIFKAKWNHKSSVHPIPVSHWMADLYSCSTHLHIILL